MARPKTDALLYFNIDVKEDDNLKYIEAIYGHLGYYVVHKLWKHIYGGPGGYYCDWGDINQHLFCRENGLAFSDLQKIVETCFSDEISLFNHDMYIKHKILTSSGVQKRWKKIVVEAGRKSCKINPDYDLTTKQNEQLNGVETTPAVSFHPPETTQSKVKESKPVVPTDSKNPKEASPATANAVSGEKFDDKSIQRPFWQKLVDCWFDFYRKNFEGEEPNFKGRNPKFFEKIYDLLLARAKKKGLDWDEKYALGAFNFFLDEAFTDDWLKGHFLLENLHKQFDSVFARANTKKRKTESKGPKSFDDELKYIVARMIEGDFDDRVITCDYYDKLVSRDLLKVGSMNNYPGTDNDEKKRNAALAWFAVQVTAVAEVA